MDFSSLDASSLDEVTSFLTKTYDAISEPNLANVISWSDSGHSFIIHQPAVFASTILPNWYKNIPDMSTFVRTLIAFGFQRIGPVESDVWEFRHDLFSRDERHLISSIKSKAESSAKASWQANSSIPVSTPSPGMVSQRLPAAHKRQTILAELVQLKQRQELLEMNLVQVMNTNDALWNDLVACKQQQREIQDNLQKVLYFLMTVSNQPKGFGSTAKQFQLPPELASVAMAGIPQQQDTQSDHHHVATLNHGQVDEGTLQARQRNQHDSQHNGFVTGIPQ